ncbi:MAG: hypothetical protein IJQ60_03630 [Prevotella sp.]|nr:hypothetical protein [Prevotella sp.]
MNQKSKASGAVLYVNLLAFIAFVVYILYINLEVLYTAHDRSEFIFGAPFFHTLMSKPFGLMQYVGAWLTQLCYRPSLGASVMMVIWTLIFCVGAKAFRLQGSASALMLLPVACLLTSIVDLGYWVYIYPVRGYWFSQSVGYLLMLLLLWAASCTPRKWHLAWYLLGVCVYPILGWFALLFVLCLILSEKLSWREALGVILLIFMSSIWHTQVYSNLKADDVVLAGFPRFITPIDSSERLSIPFGVLGAVSVLIPLCSRYLVRWFVPVLCAVAGIGFTSSLMYYDQNYIDEMRMVRLASDDNWKGVIQLAEENKRPTSTMVFLQNIALMNEGGLLNRAFKLGNNSVNINTRDTLHVSLLDIASPLVYYHYGMMNEAIRLDFENAIQAGFSPFYLKMLARCALAVGDQKLVDRYTTILHHLPFYSNWQPAPVTDKIKQMMTCYHDELTGVEDSESYLVNGISLWFETDSKVASEQTLLYAMLRCDSRRFWMAVRQYVKLHLDEQFPLHAQEAYILFMDKAPEDKRIMLPVKQSVYERYKKFWTDLEKVAKPGVTLEKVGNDMLEEYGDTYWWYNIFGRKPLNLHGKIGTDIHS